MKPALDLPRASLEVKVELLSGVALEAQVPGHEG